jgi:hypothetical protein
MLYCVFCFLRYNTLSHVEVVAIFKTANCHVAVNLCLGFIVYCAGLKLGGIGIISWLKWWEKVKGE